MAVTFQEYALGRTRRLHVSIAAEADGAVPLVELPRFSGRLVRIVVTPGTPAPSPGCYVEVRCGNSRYRPGDVFHRDSRIHPLVRADERFVLIVRSNALPNARLQVDLYYVGPPT